MISFCRTPTLVMISASSPAAFAAAVGEPDKRKLVTMGTSFPCRTYSFVSSTTVSRFNRFRTAAASVWRGRREGGSEGKEIGEGV